jgi:protein-S-isoprenylcysteine O-methyltransferase Ste14
MRNKLPLIFAASFAVAVLVLARHKLAGWDGLMRTGGIFFVGAYVAWLLLEARIAVAETRKGETRADRGTCEAYAMGRALTVITALAFPTRFTAPGPWMVIGLGVFLFGVGFRLAAIRTLGRFYSHRVRVMGDHQVVQSGPYRLVRHPAYAGMFTAHLGVVLFFFNLFALASLLLVLLPAMVVRIRVEEKALFQLPGYREYAAKRSRLVPLAW